MGKLSDSPAAMRLSVVPLINISGNLFGAAVTFVWFSVIEPRITDSALSTTVWDALVFCTLLMLLVIMAIVPIGVGRFFRPILRESRGITRDLLEKGPTPDEMSRLVSLVGRILDLPMKIALTSLTCWLALAATFGIAPQVIPEFYPWTFGKAHKIVAWMVFVGAPTTVVFTFFVLEWWLRSTIYKCFPHAVLRSVPPSRRINVLPKVLLVTFMIGTLPVGLMGHFIIHRVQDIQADPRHMEGFISQMPLAVEFLLAWALILATGLSVFLSKSISEPLKYARRAMEKIGAGDLDTVVPVVSHDDIGQLGERFNNMLDEHKELDTVRDTFGRYLSEEVVTEILKSPGGVDLRGELRDITILVSDLRGFTSMTEAQAPQAVLEIINRYLERMTDIIVLHEGTIDEFTGDGILVFFGAPRRLPDHAGKAVACALDMQNSLEILNDEFEALGLPKLQMGIGINTGELIVGNIGSEKRKKYGAVGSPINVAFRVESHTRGGEVLLTSSVYERVNGNLSIDSTREVLLKGFDTPMTLYRVVGIAEPGFSASTAPIGQ
jgi:adenylate cyclase